MADTRDTATLVFQTLGAEGLDALKSKLVAVQQQLGELNAAYGRGELAEREYDQQVKALSATHAGLSKGVDEVAKGLGLGTNKMAGLAQAALQSSRFLQDLSQGGIAGVLNNIEGMSMALGGGMGLAGVMTGLGLVVFAFKDKFTEAFQALIPDAVDPFSTALERVEKRISELEKKPHKIAIDVVELDAARAQADELKRNLEAIDRLKTSQTEAEQKSGRAVSEVLAEAPGGAQAVRAELLAQLTREREAQLHADVEAAERRAREFQGEAGRRIAAGGLSATEQSLLLGQERSKFVEAEELRKSIGATLAEFTREGGEAERGAGRIVSEATGGAGATQAASQANLRRRLGARPDLAGVVVQLESATPEAVAAEEREQRRRELTRKANEAEERRQQADVQRLEEQLHNQDAVEKQLATQTEAARKQQEAARKKAQAEEVKRIEGTVGKEYQGRAEIALAENRQAEALGAPVARSAAQEAGYRRQNIPYALPEQELAGRMQQQMIGALQARGASPAAAQAAAGDIANKASMDVARRAEQISGTGVDALQGTLELTREILQSYAQQNQMLHALMGEANRQRQALQNMQPRQRTAQSQGGFG